MMRGEFGLRVPILSAALVLAMAVPILVFLLFQRYIIQGIAMTGLKD
jgi:ABC-type glycerol-3-phosphate transport system permease component